ncbi:single-stranded-DNA-specific exonuclease RecJ [Paraburkholderia sp. UCT31]|uniref:single-stranded-DNA-specific exonuclease RecJ n=1 Tax=Paraburkholderia sp. UCT31 TaxID=2615209 RepID=UPI001655D5D5|nr:single-stranded-DNA-specific exonuclease RecJ [Paraburkholderia sp. UCT31]MBC8737263.1 single-stranded-DNA-specific exonuclease RecJ [Paraburkholderia sp. UCT31]
MQIVQRKYSPSVALALLKSGLPPLLAQILAARGIKSRSEIGGTLSDLLPYSSMKGAKEAAVVLADLIRDQKRLVIVGDYDADGATATTVGLRALRAFGANVGYLIPNRLEDGYGLQPGIVDMAAALEPRPDVIVTVDNGITSVAGVMHANLSGIPVIVTDHHLPGDETPPAKCIINPNQRGCQFGSKSLAGCGVMWYVMWALQDELKQRGMPIREGFTVESLLPIVAIGTVADVVALDRNNRILVQEGLKRIRDQSTNFPGIEALANVSKLNPRVLTTTDIAFNVGPRINAAGRLESMDAGVECLSTDDAARATELAKALHELNVRRREIEAETVDEAVEQLTSSVPAESYTAVLHAEAWHHGVIGIVAGRLKEKLYKPTVVMATSEKNQEIKGSGRSIPGFHLRDALALMDSRNPSIMTKFGGHAMAAGVTVRPGMFEEFRSAFEEVARELLTPAQLNQSIETDGALPVSDMTLETVDLLRDLPWGQHFWAPSFCDVFFVVSHKKIGADRSHLSMLLSKDGKTFKAVKFRHAGEEVPTNIRAVYKMSANPWQGKTDLQLLVDHFESA